MRSAKNFPDAPPISMMPLRFPADAQANIPASTDMPSAPIDTPAPGAEVQSTSQRATTSPEAAPSNQSVAEQEAQITQQVGLLRQLLDNTATTTGAGWTANMLHATAREGTIYYLATTIREVVGQLAARKLEHVSEPVKVGTSMSIIAAVGMLNALVAVQQRINGRGNWMTLSAQASNIGLLGAAAAIASKTGGLGKATASLIKATEYSASLGAIGLFIRPADNRDPDLQHANGRAVFTNMVVYGVSQIAVFKLQGLGAAYPGTSDSALATSAKDAFGHFSAFAAANAAGEVINSLIYPALTAFYDKLAGGVPAALHGVRDLRLTTRVHVPVGKDVINNWAGREVVGGVTRDDVLGQATGPSLARESLFVILYTVLDAFSKAGPAAHLSPGDSEDLTNTIAGLSIGLLSVAYIYMLSASPRRAAAEPDLEAVPTGHDAPAATDEPGTAPQRPDDSTARS
ncbi:hypothetical protein [Burkholderia cepacia]|uniref:hypothetical protein n=1 Tax=Burkholderia cepacia TaxID=292 RepID=UPI00158ABA37|nr:hypothetical protein [Burkholderia cepacia]